jgi:glycosyltransferase involved in cell wall biosynthesis
MVQAQAMACGCPVIGTEHSGAEDLFEDGKEGFIVRIRQSDEIADKLQRLADDPSLRATMSNAASARVQRVGGWREYGNHAWNTYRALVA